MLMLMPIGQVIGGRTAAVDDHWATVESVIRLNPARLDRTATDGLDAFSHVHVIYQFHRAHPSDEVRGARHPRGREDWPKVGILAQRGKDRPNHLGMSMCELVRVAPYHVYVRGLDALHGSPVLDIKPVMRGFGPRGDIREPEWARDLMAHYW